MNSQDVLFLTKMCPQLIEYRLAFFPRFAYEKDGSVSFLSAWSESRVIYLQNDGRRKSGTDYPDRSFHANKKVSRDFQQP